MRYFIQHPAGTGSLVQEALNALGGDVEVVYQDDSAVMFESNAKPASIGAAPFAKNAFLVMTTVGRGNINKNVAHLSRVLATARFPSVSRRGAGYRIMVHVDGKLMAVEQNAKRSLEQSIAARTGERLQPRGMSEEYWVIGRAQLDQLLFCLRLPRKQMPPKVRGAISYELSYMLVAASRPSGTDFFLDPFAGSGAFVQARLDYPAREIAYSDQDLNRLRPSLDPQLTRNRRVRFLNDDALTLPSIKRGQVDVIVTDPPWGEHEDISVPYSEFTKEIAHSFERVLHPVAGRFVLLVSRRSAPLFVTSVLDEGFSIRASHEILVNGHPATVLIGGRR